MQPDDTLRTFSWLNGKTEAVLCPSPAKDLELRRKYQYTATGRDGYNYYIETHAPSMRKPFRSSLNFPEAFPAEIKFQDEKEPIRIVKLEERAYAWTLRLKNGRPADTDFSEWSQEGQLLWKKIDSNTWEIWDSRSTESLRPLQFPWSSSIPRIVGWIYTKKTNSYSLAQSLRHVFIRSDFNARNSRRRGGLVIDGAGSAQSITFCEGMTFPASVEL
ncbi:hypothetical protein C8J57DRAFT_1229938 [Mycena rebaudengoi]|nr:hypothetical protein C8J57DRAFT_1229938 [Mycena rebaudengoi]